MSGILLLILLLLVFFLFLSFLANIVVKALPLWFIFKKINIAPWKSLIPYYSDYEIIKFCGFSGWFICLYFIPTINVLFGILLRIKFGQKINQSIWFSIGLGLFPIIFFPILAIKDFEITDLRCQNCGSEIKGAGIYCVNCGIKL